MHIGVKCENEGASVRVEREPLRQKVRDVLVGRLFTGELEHGEISEPELASELGVSRTPIREALIWLEAEGLVQSRPGRGFAVRPLDPEEGRELYSLVGTLERLALDGGKRVNRATLRALEKIDAMRRRTSKPSRLIELDARWHATLLEDSVNGHLIRVLDLLKTQLYRYEYAYMSDRDRRAEAIDQHAAIIDALRQDQPGRAAGLLEHHWTAGMDSTLDWQQDGAGEAAG